MNNLTSKMCDIIYPFPKGSTVMFRGQKYLGEYIITKWYYDGQDLIFDWVDEKGRKDYWYYHENEFELIL